MPTTTNHKSHANDGCSMQGWLVLPEYVPDIGAPFKVTLCNAVRQRVSDSGEVLETEIPNLGGLLKEAAVARALCRRKLSPADIKFLRKAVNLKGVELAKLLGISAEHLSRCENEGRALSPAADKLIRVIVLKKRYNFASLQEWIKTHAEKKTINEEELGKLQKVVDEYIKSLAEVEKAIFEGSIQSVYDAGKEIEFSFYLESRDVTDFDGHCPPDEEKWKRAA